MKQLKLKYLLVALLPLAMWSCAEDETLVKLNSDAKVEPTSSASEVVLTKEGAGTDVLTISWPKPDYGYSAGPIYTIYLMKEGGDWAENAVPMSVGSNLGKTFKNEELNKQLINLGFIPGEAAVLNVKVESKLGPSTKITSEVISVDATAYAATLDLSTNWGVVGSGFNNWGAFPDAPFYQTTDPNLIVSYVTLLTGEIKFRQDNTWTNNYGDNGGDGTLDKDGANIPVTAGIYKITFNTTTFAYTIVKYSWGIVGSAYNDWGATPDYPFYYDDATDQWRAIVKLLDGEFKIRKNNDWGTNYGDTGNDGTLDNGGDNIVVTAGKYLVTFSENDLSWSIEPVEHIWGLVGSAYNDWGATPDAQFQMDFHNEGVWVLKGVQLLAGEWKIRDDSSWGTNYGDDGGDLSLEANGANIVATAGYYTVTLDFSNPSSPTYTSVKHP